MNAKGVSLRRLQRTLFVAGFIVLVVLAYTAPRAIAQDRAAHQMRFTINQRVEFPGRVLDPGTYYIRRDMPPLRESTDAMIEVLDNSRQHVLVSTIGIPARRLENTEGISFIFYEAPAGTPPPVRTWYLPGDVEGYDFVYPKAHLAAIAAALHTNAPTTAEATYTPLPQPAPEAAVPEAPQAAAAEPPQEPEQRIEQPPQQMAQAPEPEQPATLPKTAGELPILLLLGCVSLFGGGVLRLARRY